MAYLKGVLSEACRTPPTLIHLGVLYWSFPTRCSIASLGSLGGGRRGCGRGGRGDGDRHLRAGVVWHRGLRAQELLELGREDLRGEREGGDQ